MLEVADPNLSSVPTAPLAVALLPCVTEVLPNLADLPLAESEEVSEIDAEPTPFFLPLSDVEDVLVLVVLPREALPPEAVVLLALVSDVEPTPLLLPEALVDDAFVLVATPPAPLRPDAVVESA